MALEIHGCLLKHYSLIIFSKSKEIGNILHLLFVAHVLSLEKLFGLIEPRDGILTSECQKL